MTTVVPLTRKHAIKQTSLHTHATNNNTMARAMLKQITIIFFQGRMHTQ